MCCGFVLQNAVCSWWTLVYLRTVSLRFLDEDSRAEPFPAFPSQMDLGESSLASEGVDVEKSTGELTLLMSVFQLTSLYCAIPGESSWRLRTEIFSL